MKPRLDRKVSPGNRPVAYGKNEIKSPVLASQNVEARKWFFSFRYFSQIENFGVSNQKNSWFVSLLQRLKDLSGENNDSSFFRFYRYHRIDWSAKGIPIKKEDLSWVPKAYLSNDVEFPIVQFQLSKAKGRVIGFWGEESNVFHIVLLDPEHNLQPSKKFSYNVTSCKPIECQYTSLLKDVDEVKRIKSCNPSCPLRDKISQIPLDKEVGNITAFFLDDDYHEELDKQLNIKGKSLTDIVELGLLRSE